MCVKTVCIVDAQWATEVSRDLTSSCQRTITPGMCVCVLEVCVLEVCADVAALCPLCQSLEDERWRHMSACFNSLILTNWTAWPRLSLLQSTQPLVSSKGHRDTVRFVHLVLSVKSPTLHALICPSTTTKPADLKLLLNRAQNHWCFLSWTTQIIYSNRVISSQREWKCVQHKKCLLNSPSCSCSGGQSCVLLFQLGTHFQNCPHTTEMQHKWHISQCWSKLFC